MSTLKRSFSLTILALSVVAALACAGQGSRFPIASLDGEGFHHVTYDYSVLSDPRAGDLLSRDWRLDNYVPSEEGLGEPKEGDDYVAEIGLDSDGDGEYETRVKIPTFDLLYKHRRNDGRLFLSTIPISQYDSERELSVMLRDLVGRASHGGRVTYDFTRGTARASGEMASRILTSRPVTVSGYPAHEVIFEVANVQQLELTPDARWVRSHIVIVRTDFVFTRNQLGPAFRVPTIGRSIPTGTFYPVLMVIGYSNHPDEFDDHHPEFRDFVSRVRLSDGFPLDALEATRATCGIEQLDVIVSQGLVYQSSLPYRSEQAQCASDGLMAITMADSPWRRTFSVRAQPLRSPGGTTTAGGPLDAPSTDTATSGGEAPGPAVGESPVAP